MSYEFTNVQLVKAVRKPHQCDVCRTRIVVGYSAVRWSGKVDGDFHSAIMHPECRKAEIAYNKDFGQFDDDWISLEEAIEEGDGADDWLREKHPTVAVRILRDGEL